MTKKFLAFMLILLISVSISAEQVTLRVLHTNDLHGALKPSSTSEEFNYVQIGGFDIIKSYVHLQKMHSLLKGEIFLFADAGDFYQGTPVGDFTKGEAVIKTMNLLGYECGTIGNHEFDHSLLNMEKICRMANFPMICNNLVLKDSNEIPDFLKPYVIIEKNGIKIGITAVMTEGLADVTLAENIKEVKVLPVVPELRKVLDKMREEGAQITILLSHMGVDEDQELCKKIKDIDLIIGSHSHTMLKKPVIIENGPMIVQAFNKGFCIGNVEMVFDTEKNKIVKRDAKLDFLMHDKYPSSFMMKEEVEKQGASIEGQLQEKICVLNKDYSIDDLCVIFGEMLRVEFSTDIGFNNVGGVRAPLQNGQIVFEDVYNVLPFNNRLMRFSLTGKDIQQIVESTVAKPKYGLLIASGLDIKVSKDKKVSIFFQGKPLETNKKYSCTTNNFLLSGGDGFPQFKNATDIEFTGMEMREFVLEYMKSKGGFPEVKSPYEFQ